MKTTILLLAIAISLNTFGQDKNLVALTYDSITTNYNLNPNDSVIIITPKSQKLFLVTNGITVKDYIISTGKTGTGCLSGSGMTPYGTHRIKGMFGKGATSGAIFKSRVNTGKKAVIYTKRIDTDDDHVTTRIMWLDGLERGVNKGGNVDSRNRYIYIHGTPEEGLLGQPASHGCIRMRNDEVIELFDLVRNGMIVEILNEEFKKDIN